MKWRGANIEPLARSGCMNDPGASLFGLAKEKVLCMFENAGWRALPHHNQRRLMMAIWLMQ